MTITGTTASAQDQTLEVVKLAEGIYGSIYSEMKMDPVESNSMFVITPTGVLVVDASYTPAGARATIAAIRKLTTQPVRYVVTTHWHDDHIFGNQAYRDAFPGVHFVAQVHTRQDMIRAGQQHQEQLVSSYSRAIPRMEARISTGVDSAGTPYSAAYLAELRRNLPIYRTFLENVRDVKVVLPTITFERALTLYLGDTEVQVMHFGKGNTPGDAVIFLPGEKIAAVGDLVVFPVPFIYGGYPGEWRGIMQSVRELGATTIVPGHGPVMRDMVYFDLVTELLASLSSQVRDAVKRGLTLEDTRKAVNLESFRSRMVQGDKDRNDTFEASIMQQGIRAAYQEAKAKQG